MTAYARFTFPGLRYIQSGTVSLGHGTTPTGFRVTVAPQDPGEVIDQGTFALEYNDERLEFTGCRVDRARFSMNRSGQLIELTILDRRWKWGMAYTEGPDTFGRISGEYNVRNEDGTIKRKVGGDPAKAIEVSERTPQQLAELLLMAAGETVAPGSLAALPADVRPYVSWDSANPMQELERLCEALGCRVVLNPLDNLVHIHKVNQGRLLPVNWLVSYGGGASFNDSPDQVDVLTAPILWQYDLLLRAVGLDIDGLWKPIDELSYKPEGGWVDLDLFSNGGEFDDLVKRNLALRTVYRAYEVLPFNANTGTAPIELRLPGANASINVNSREQIILTSNQVATEIFDGIKHPRPNMVYGIWYMGDDAQAENSVEHIEYLPDESLTADPEVDEKARMIVQTSFSLDAERGLVMFSEPVYAESESTGDFEAATLRLRTGFYVRNEETAGMVRFRRFRKITNAANPYSLDLRHDEIKPTVLYKFSGRDFVEDDVIRNEIETDLEIEHYLDEAVARFGAANIPQSAEYGGWRFDIALDGAIQAITWTLNANGGPPTTYVDRNHDSGRSGMPYKTLRAYQKMADWERNAASTQWRAEQDRLLSRAQLES